MTQDKSQTTLGPQIESDEEPIEITEGKRREYAYKRKKRKAAAKRKEDNDAITQHYGLKRPRSPSK